MSCDLWIYMDYLWEKVRMKKRGMSGKSGTEKHLTCI